MRLPVAAAGRWDGPRPLGAGGMGVTLLVHDRKLGRDVVFKTLRSDLTGNDEALARLRREVDALARVVHPNVVRILDVLEEGGALWYVMDFVAGEPLDEVLRCGRPPVRAALAWGVALADAVAAAHEAGVLHRDIKPGNVVLRPDGAPVLIDFGLALVDDDVRQTRLTATGQLMGTLAYLPPDLLRGGRPDERSDVYQVAAVVYEALTGLPPYDAAALGALLGSRTAPAPAPLPASSARPGLPSDLDTLLAQGLAADPARRLGSAVKLRDGLQACLEGSPVATQAPVPATGPAATPGVPRRSRSWPALVLPTGALLLVALVLGLGAPSPPGAAAPAAAPLPEALAALLARRAEPLATVAAGGALPPTTAVEALLDLSERAWGTVLEPERPALVAAVRAQEDLPRGARPWRLALEACELGARGKKATARERLTEALREVRRALVGLPIEGQELRLKLEALLVRRAARVALRREAAARAAEREALLASSVSFLWRELDVRVRTGRAGQAHHASVWQARIEGALEDGDPERAEDAARAAELREGLAAARGAAGAASREAWELTGASERQVLSGKPVGVLRVDAASEQGRRVARLTRQAFWLRDAVASAADASPDDLLELVNFDRPRSPMLARGGAFVVAGVDGQLGGGGAAAARRARAFDAVVALARGLQRAEPSSETGWALQRCLALASAVWRRRVYRDEQERLLEEGDWAGLVERAVPRDSVARRWMEAAALALAGREAEAASGYREAVAAALDRPGQGAAFEYWRLVGDLCASQWRLLGRPAGAPAELALAVERPFAASVRAAGAEPERSSPHFLLQYRARLYQAEAARRAGDLPLLARIGVGLAPLLREPELRALAEAEVGEEVVADLLGQR